VDTAVALPWLSALPAIVTLRQVWAEQYTDPPEPPRWRAVTDLASAGALIASPYDPEARWSTKRGVDWVGYKVHLTETCNPDTPHRIIQVETTPATIQDDQLLPTIHTALAAEGLLPREHLVDAGYTTAAVLVTSQREHGVAVVDPVARDPSWQAKAGEGFEKARFVVDWEAEMVTCPAGKRSLSWHPVTDPTKDAAFHVRFARSDCLACADRTRCTKAKSEPRELMLQMREEYEALHAMRQRCRLRLNFGSPAELVVARWPRPGGYTARQGGVVARSAAVVGRRRCAGRSCPMPSHCTWRRC